MMDDKFNKAIGPDKAGRFDYLLPTEALEGFQTTFAQNAQEAAAGLQPEFVNKLMVETGFTVENNSPICCVKNDSGDLIFTVEPDYSRNKLLSVINQKTLACTRQDIHRRPHNGEPSLTVPKKHAKVFTEALLEQYKEKKKCTNLEDALILLTDDGAGPIHRGKF